MKSWAALLLVLVAGGCRPASPAQQPVKAEASPRPSSTPKVMAMPSPTPKVSPVPAKLSSYPAQRERWEAAQLRSQDLIRLDRAVALFTRTEARYRAIEAMRVGGMPAPIVFAIHGRESTWNFAAHLHEGSPLTHRTRFVPKGRPLTPDPPYTFEQSAEDALYILKREDLVDWKNAGPALQAVEAYNGLGYQKYHPDVPSPYLWAGTTLYARGKYVADGRFDKMAVDKQLGCAAILKRMGERGIKPPFD